MDNERDAEDAIRGLYRIEFGSKGRRLCVEWTKLLERDDKGNASPVASKYLSLTNKAE
ncbi:unnamed protein product [Brassica rapa]|uniref:Uncharacterized protein n=1 Tax=Brassica campestris TaxID=3711 RepID=A0A3P5ZRW0_BRACM|nr:unnamed protein product [Brassica rapa]VDC83456.1 unnamed protein product [Brassica rapa]